MRNLILSIALVAVVWPALTITAMAASALAVFSGCLRSLADLWTS